MTVKIPNCGSVAAYNTLKSYAKNINEYKEHRDFPNINGTSRLSMYLKNGSITVPQIITFLKLKAYKKKRKLQKIFFSVN